MQKKLKNTGLFYMIDSILKIIPTSNIFTFMPLSDKTWSISFWWPNNDEWQTKSQTQPLPLNNIYHTKKIRQNLRMTEDRFVNREISSKMFGIYTGISKTEINGQNLDLFDVIRNVIWLVILVCFGIWWLCMFMLWHCKREKLHYTKPGYDA